MDLVERLRRLGTTPTSRLVPPAWTSLFAAYRRGDHDTVLREAGPAFVTLSTTPGGEAWLAGPPLLAGTVLAAREQLAPAVEALRDGLARLPGTAVADQLGDGDWHTLALVEVLVLRGELEEAAARTDHLLSGRPPVEVRLGATRAAVHLRIVRGELDAAHHLCNAAADLAGRARSNLGATLVETDRAVLAAAGGHHANAAHTAFEVGGRLVAGGRSPHALLAAAQAGVLGLAVARAAADAGDTITAGSMAELAQQAATVTGRRVEHVRALLATSAAARTVGDAELAEGCARAGTADALALGAEPLAALGLVEQADLAAALGLWASARPLAERAAAELDRLGLRQEASRFARRRHVPSGPGG